MPPLMFMSPLPLANIMYAFTSSNFSGKAIVFVLVAGSVLAWAVMISKGFEIWRACRETSAFHAAYRKEHQPLTLFLRRRSFDSPVFKLYDQACRQVCATMDLRGPQEPELFLETSSLPRLSSAQLSVVRVQLERGVADQALMLEQNMGILALAISAGPLLGLLGTVWGVMDAFGAIALTGSALLSAVAPGITGALLTTVIGLLVALPSAIGYNLLTNRIRYLCVQMDNFAGEFATEIEASFCSQK